ncbi:hypothetical protein LT493_22345 [Streptomyces tricolor]|nr:hypothetical protein [Streptomyces tricolor]
MGGRDGHRPRRDRVRAGGVRAARGAAGRRKGHPARLPGVRVFCRAAPSRTAPGGPNARRTVSDPHPLGEEMA